MIALQRFVYTSPSGSSIQLTTLLLAATVAWVVVRVRVSLQIVNVVLYLALAVLAAVSTVVAGSRGALSTSTMSLVFFLLTYSTSLIAGARGGEGLGQHFFAGAISAMKIGALLGVVQFAAQYIGLGFWDPVKSLPSQWVRTGFNSYYALGQTGEFKPNGVIFLEPSFLSLYAALALVAVTGQTFSSAGSSRTARNLFWMAVLAAGFAVSASASGLVVIAVALVPLVFSFRRNRRLLVVVGVGLAGAIFTGAFNLVVVKASEGFSGNTSSALRLTLPYQLMRPYWLEQPLFGWGPGAATSIMDEVAVPGLQASTVMKLLVEYGLLSALVLTTCVWISFHRGGAPLYLMGAVLAAWLIPAEALLNSTLVFLVFVVIPNWRRSVERETVRSQVDTRWSGGVSVRLDPSTQSAPGVLVRGS